MELSTLLTYYKREDIRKAILECADDKEIAVHYRDGHFGKRPDVLKYSKDILELAKKGASSFHCSEELWQNPLQLGPGLKKSDMDELRIGWDLILDIDCPHLEYSKLAADLLIKALEYNSVKTISIKFSGNHGFHIAVPFNAFPKTVNGIPTKQLFPDGPRKIAAYLQEMIRVQLAKQILKMDSITNISKNVNKKYDDLVKNKQLDPFEVLDIDTILISSRHLYRMPYSFNEKSGLVSIPITKEQILNFKKADAKPEKVKTGLKFLKKTPIPNEATKLIIQAFDFKIEKEEFTIKKQREFSAPESAIPEEFFPPCIKIILKGLKDGRQRAIFILINFLSSCGWDYEGIETLLKEWGKRHEEPLREVTILGQIRYHKEHKKKVLPPNCLNKSYYQDLQFCSPDGLCKKIKNPVNYAIIRQKLNYLTQKKKKTKTVK